MMMLMMMPMQRMMLPMMMLLGYHGGMTYQRIPMVWWDQIFNGEAWDIDLSALGGILGKSAKPVAFRNMIYRQAADRGFKVGTHLAPGLILRVKAWRLVGPHDLADVDANPAPVPVQVQVREPGLGTRAYVELRGRILRAQDDLTEEQLLGPCSCGQSPKCLPTCVRVTGVQA